MKKVKKISISTLILILFIGIVGASVISYTVIQNKVKTGTVEVDDINLQLIDSAGEKTKEIADWDPGDIKGVTWKVKNIGTAAVYTRNKLKIYWNEEVPNEDQVIYLYPANLTKEEILEDFKSEDGPKKAINVNYEKIADVDKYGLVYEISGDILDGTKSTGKSQEVNYNSGSTGNVTDDNNVSEDDICFNILLSPKTSYLFEEKTLTVEVITEAMQYEHNENSEWTIVDTEIIS